MESRPGSACDTCGRLIPFPLRRCRRRRCDSYSGLWAGDQRRKLFANLQTYADVVPAGVKHPGVLLLAVTGPGQDALPWDRDHCKGLGDHTCSGSLGCRVRSVPASAFNTRAPRLWRSLHRHAYVRTRREGLRPWLLTRVWEMQLRGVLHAHPVLAFSTPAEKKAARRYQHHLAELAREHGFGFVERKELVREPSAAAAYLSAYFIIGKKGKTTLQESVKHPAMPRSIVHVSTVLTQLSGVTMRWLRLVRYLHVLDRITGGLVDLEDLGLVAAPP